MTTDPEESGHAARMRLVFQGPLEWEATLAYLRPRVTAGIESVTANAYRRTVLIDGSPGAIEVSQPEPGHLLLSSLGPDPRLEPEVILRARRLFRLDTDVTAAHAVVGSGLATRFSLLPKLGLRPLGAFDLFETGVRVILGQQVTVTGATTLSSRLVGALGTPVQGLESLGLTHMFPEPASVAAADLGTLGVPRSRQRALLAFSTAVATGELDLDARPGLEEFTARITSLPGLGPWTAQLLALRAGYEDAFPSSDLGIRRALAQPGAAPVTASAAEEIAAACRPWRAHLAMNLWRVAGLEHPQTAAMLRSVTRPR